MNGRLIRIRGTVQGVGFRPMVWRLARELGVVGRVWNDSEGVVVEAWGSERELHHLTSRIQSESPPLSIIDSIAVSGLPGSRAEPMDFQIDSSQDGITRTAVSADVATCDHCLAEIMDSAERRFRYPFTNCTHCGPRLSIITGIPYDRSNTAMAAFSLCDRCQQEYDDPGDRRFHAQPIACPECGPGLWLEDSGGSEVRVHDDVISHAAQLIASGNILSIKGIGGFHLACDAGNPAAVDALRQRKQRYFKAFALMARDIDMVARYARVSEAEREMLNAPAAPVVVMDADGEKLAHGIAPGQHTLGFMLPYSPLHHLLMSALQRPIVLTSGNLSSEPQCIDNRSARDQLESLVDYHLMHDRDIINRLDDSVLRFAAGKPRILRRARGYAPRPIMLHREFATSTPILAMGAELKNTFCLLRDGQACVSQHIGDLKNARCFRDYRHNLELYKQLLDFSPAVIAVDLHRDYLSTQVGHDLASGPAIEVVQVQHHHAHVASTMAELGMAPDCAPVLGVVWDGLGMGTDDTLWGGEFLLADFRTYTRLAYFQPTPLPGGIKAMQEPWRNAWIHLRQAFGWKAAVARYGGTEIVRFLSEQSLATLDTMVDNGLNSPLSSSCGRLFDAVAAVLGICRERQLHEGQAAIELESMAASAFHAELGNGYRSVNLDGDNNEIQWQWLWNQLMEDLKAGVDRRSIAARFHHGLIDVLSETVQALCEMHQIETVILTGGVFQNQLLLEGAMSRLHALGIEVHSPTKTPANDGGIALGQAVVASVRLMSENRCR